MSESNTPSILPALYQETKNIVNTSNVKLYDWAAGLEMEATYILHPLDTTLTSTSVSSAITGAENISPSIVTTPIIAIINFFPIFIT